MTVRVTYTPPPTLKVQPTGAPGLSAYAVAVGEGYPGTVEEWLASLVGPAGASAYEAAVEEGFVGDQTAWVASLAGADGQPAYEVAVANGFVGDQAAWLASLVGPEGPTAVSADAGNAATLGTDSLIYVPTPTPAPVDSVNAQTGVVVLDAADVGAAAAAHEHPAAEISDATVTGQALITAVDAAAARAAIGAGTGSSDFDGAYSSLSGTPTLGTAAAADAGDFATAAQGSTADSAVQPGDLGTAAVLDVPATGDAAAGEVVKGDDSRLSDARTPTAHSHTVSDVTDAGTAASADATDFATAAQGGLADSAVQPADLGGAAVLDVGTTAGTVAAGDDARIVAGGTAVQPGDLATVATSGAYADLSGTPALGTAAALDAPATGDAAAGEVVLGSDSRLGGGGASALDDLTDVDTSTSAPATGNALVWDGTNWVPGVVPGGGGGTGVAFLGLEWAASSLVGTQTRSDLSGSSYAQQSCNLSTPGGPFRIDEIVWSGAYAVDTYELFIDGVSYGTRTSTGTNEVLTWSGLDAVTSSAGAEVAFVPTGVRRFGYNSANGGFINNGLVFGDWVESPGNTVPMAVTFTPLALVELTTSDMPAGGTTGQVLAKASATDFDTEWVDQSAGGGTYSGARVSRSTDQAITAGAYAAVVWDTEEWDTDGYWAASPNPSRLTAPSDGYYLITGAVSLTATDSTPVLGSLRVDGTVRAIAFRWEADGASDKTFSFAQVLHLTSGAYVDIAVFQGTGNFSVNASTDRTSLQITRLGSNILTGARTVKAKTSGNTTLTTTMAQIGESITVAAAAGDEFWLSIDGTVENQDTGWGSSFELHITSGTPRQLGGTMQPNKVFCAVSSRIPVTIQASDITAGEVVFQVKASAGANRTLRSNTTSPFYFCLEPA